MFGVSECSMARFRQSQTLAYGFWQRHVSPASTREMPPPSSLMNSSNSRRAVVRDSAARTSGPTHPRADFAIDPFHDVGGLPTAQLPFGFAGHKTHATQASAPFLGAFVTPAQTFFYGRAESDPGPGHPEEHRGSGRTALPWYRAAGHSLVPAPVRP